MGFCLFNNVAVAAARARTLGANRVAIVDFDVHHGNGTQHTFERDPSILCISTHQYPITRARGPWTKSASAREPASRQRAARIGRGR
jgi:acetoin utilization deacetylase AcuC-like enzyme